MRGGFWLHPSFLIAFGFCYGPVRQTTDYLRCGFGRNRRHVSARIQITLAAFRAIARRHQLVEPERFGESLFPTDDDVAAESAANGDLLAVSQIIRWRFWKPAT